MAEDDSYWKSRFKESEAMRKIEQQSRGLIKKMTQRKFKFLIAFLKSLENENEMLCPNFFKVTIFPEVDDSEEAMIPFCGGNKECNKEKEEAIRLVNLLQHDPGTIVDIFFQLVFDYIESSINSSLFKKRKYSLEDILKDILGSMKNNSSLKQEALDPSYVLKQKREFIDEQFSEFRKKYGLYELRFSSQKYDVNIKTLCESEEKEKLVKQYSGEWITCLADEQDEMKIDVSRRSSSGNNKKPFDLVSSDEFSNNITKVQNKEFDISGRGIILNGDFGIKDYKFKGRLTFNLFRDRIGDVATNWCGVNGSDKKHDVIAPYFSIVQSSGSGKTKLLHQYYKKCQKENLMMQIDNRNFKEIPILFYCGPKTRNETRDDWFVDTLNTESIKERNTLELKKAFLLAELEKQIKEKSIFYKNYERKVFVLLFDEASWFFDEMDNEDAICYRIVRWFIRLKKYNNNDSRIVAVFCGTNHSLSQYIKEIPKSNTYISRDTSKSNDDFITRNTDQIYPPFTMLLNWNICFDEHLEISDESPKRKNRESLDWNLLRRYTPGRPLFVMLHIEYNMKKEKEKYLKLRNKIRTRLVQKNLFSSIESLSTENLFSSIESLSTAITSNSKMNSNLAEKHCIEIIEELDSYVSSILLPTNTEETTSNGNKKIYCLLSSRICLGSTRQKQHSRDLVANSYAVLGGISGTEWHNVVNTYWAVEPFLAELVTECMVYAVGFRDESKTSQNSFINKYGSTSLFLSAAFLLSVDNFLTASLGEFSEEICGLYLLLAGDRVRWKDKKSQNEEETPTMSWLKPEINFVCFLEEIFVDLCFNSMKRKALKKALEDKAKWLSDSSFGLWQITKLHLRNFFVEKNKIDEKEFFIEEVLKEMYNSGIGYLLPDNANCFDLFLALRLKDETYVPFLIQVKNRYLKASKIPKLRKNSRRYRYVSLLVTFGEENDTFEIEECDNKKVLLRSTFSNENKLFKGFSLVRGLKNEVENVAIDHSYVRRRLNSQTCIESEDFLLKEGKHAFHQEALNCINQLKKAEPRGSRICKGNLSISGKKEKTKGGGGKGKSTSTSSKVNISGIKEKTKGGGGKGKSTSTSSKVNISGIKEKTKEGGKGNPTSKKRKAREKSTSKKRKAREKSTSKKRNKKIRT